MQTATGKLELAYSVQGMLRMEFAIDANCELLGATSSLRNSHDATTIPPFMSTELKPLTPVPAQHI